MKKTKFAMLLVMVLVFVLQSVGMTSAAEDPSKLVTTGSEWTKEQMSLTNLVGYMGPVSQYGVVAGEYIQGGHSEANVFADLLTREDGRTDPFLASGDTVAATENSHVQATLTLPEVHVADEMTFGLFYLDDSGNLVEVAHEGSNHRITVDVAGQTAVKLVFPAVTCHDHMMKNLYIRQIENGQPVDPQNTDGMKITYGPPVISERRNALYLGDITYSNDDVFNLFQNANDVGVCDVMELGDGIKLYQQKDGAFVELTPGTGVGQVVDKIYIHDADWPTDAEKPYKIINNLVFDTDGKFKLSESKYEIDVVYLEEKDSHQAADLLKDLAELSYNLSNSKLGLGGNLKEGMKLGDLPQEGGNSTITGSTEDGAVLSLYAAGMTATSTATDFYVDMSSLLSAGGDPTGTGWANGGLPIADNEYVIINVEVPYATGTLHLNDMGLELSLRNSDGTQHKTNMWRAVSNLSFSRVIWNPVYMADDGSYQPFQGTVLAGNTHGGVVLAPCADINQPSVGDSVTLIGETVHNSNGQEIHQTSFQGARTFVRMINEPTTEVRGKKIWKADEAANRPEKIKITLWIVKESGNVAVATHEVTAEDNWEWAFTNLPKTQDGEKIEYTITERPVSHYDAPVVGQQTEEEKGNDRIITQDVTNTYNPDLMVVAGQKIWNDGNDQDGIRPDAIKVTLLSRWGYWGYDVWTNRYTWIWTEWEPHATTLSKIQEDTDHFNKADPVTVTEADNWSWVFDNLPAKTRNMGSTFTWEYKVEETTVDGKPVIDGYTTEYSNDGDHTVNPDGEYNIINTHRPSKISIKGSKFWLDENNKLKTRPNDAQFEARRKIEGGEWEDAKDISGNKLHAQVTEEKGWSWEFKDVPAYDANGNLYTYEVYEVNPNSNYWPEIQTNTDANGNMSVTVYNIMKTVELKGSKTWAIKVPNSMMPAKLAIDIMREIRASGEIENDPANDVVVDTLLVDSNGGTYTWNVRLPAQDASGNEAKYYPVEQAVPGFEPSRTGNDPVVGTITNTNMTGEIYNWTLTNTLITVDVSATKVWQDANNAYKTRPTDPNAKMTFEVKRRVDGGTWGNVNIDGIDSYACNVTGQRVGNNATMRVTVADLEDAKNVITFSGLPKYDTATGKEWEYTIVESDVPNGYEVTHGETVKDEDADDFSITITNRLKGKISGKKEWQGEGFGPGATNGRPDEITLNLLYKADEKTEAVVVATIVVPKQNDNSWEWEFNGIPEKLSEKELAKFTVVEDAVAGYVSTPGTAENDFTVINTKSGVTTATGVEKTVETDGYNSPDGLEFAFRMEYVSGPEDGYQLDGADVASPKVTTAVIKYDSRKSTNETEFKLSFDKEGDYTFKVSEVVDKDKTGNIKYDQSEYTVTYKVKRGVRNLQITTEIKKDNKPVGNKMTFTNKYAVVSIGGEKLWTGLDTSERLPITAKNFKDTYLKLYTLTKDAENKDVLTPVNVKPTVGTEESAERGTSFRWFYSDLPWFDANGNDLQYVVKEMTVNGYQTFYVNVKGKSYRVGAEDALYPMSKPQETGLTVHNTLSKGALTINKTVKVDGTTDTPEVDEFQFTITPTTGLTGYHFVDAEGKELTSPVTVAVEKNADGTISGALPVTILFDNFTEAKKEFAFTVAEVKPDPIPAGWTYDATAQNVTFTVTRNANDYTVTVSPDEAEVDFTNAYKKTFEGSVSFYVNKKLDGKSSTVPFSFELLQRVGDEELEQLAVQENSIISDDPNAVLPAGVAAFELEYDDDDLGKTYEYVIRELKKDGYTRDTAEYKYKVVISEAGEITRYYWDSETADYEVGNSHALFSNKTLTSVTVYKYWPNSERQDVSAYLFLCTLDADGTLTKLDPQPTESKTDNVDSSQTYTWSDLSKFDAAGNEITYAVIEEGLEGYAPEYPEGRNYAKNEETIVNNVIRDNFYIYKQVPDTDEIHTASLSFDFTITPGVADGFTLSAHDVDDLEPKLLTPDGEGLYTVSLGAGNQMNFDVVFTKAGTYTFTVEEKFDEVPDGWVYDEHAYIVTFEVGEDGSVKKLEKDDLDCHFTNEYHGTTGLTVCKEWVGAAASDIPVKPENFDQFLTLRYAAYPLDEDGNIDDDYEFTEDDWTVYEDEYGFEVTVYEDEPNKWYVEYANLPNAIEGKEVTWSVVEDPIDGFTTKYTDDKQWAESWATITNSSVLTSASINKAWLNESFESADKVPNIADKLTLCKLVDGVPVPVENAPTPVYIPDTENSGMYTWNDLPMFENGKEIEYVVIEQKMDGYEQTYFDRYGCIIENGTYAPHGGGIDNAKVEEEIETTNVSVMKVWVGGPLVDSDISDNLVLFADGVAQTDKPTKTDNVYAWYDLPKYDEDGELITYSIKEDDVADGYTVTYQDENGEDAGDAAFDGGMITNTYEEKTYESEGEVAFDGIKIFDGHTMEGGEFTFILTDKSGKELQRVTNAADGTFAFDPIKYTEKDVPYGTEAEFTYYITELEGKLPGVTYDDAKYEITVGLWDDTDGTIHVGDISDSADGIIFTNTYKAEGSVTFQGAKFLLGREFKAGDEFTFELLNDKGDVIDTVTINPTSGTKADFAFKTIKYNLDDAGKNYTYTYRVKEKAGTEDGMIYDDTVHTVTVTVSDAGDGTLKVVASDAAKHLNFTNTYLAEGAVIFSGTKTMEGKELAGNDFTFVLTDADGKVIETVTNDKDGKIVFSTIEYELEDAGKTFTYKVSEKNDGKKAVTYDNTVYTVTVKVEDAGSGHLKVTASDNATKLNFKNSYEAKAVLTMNAYKTVNGYKPSVDQVYDFVLQGNDGTEMKAQNKAETITFGTIAFDEEDIGKTFIYTVKETTEANELLDVDAAIYQVKVTVVDNGDGNLKLETEILKDGKRANGVVFANTATATLAISKNVKGPGPDKAFDLKVTFIGVDGKELEGVYDYDGDVKGTITSGGVIALKDGQSVTIVGLPEGATYTVEENAGPAYTVTVNGKPIAKAEGTLVGHGKLEFINTVEVTTFSVTKVWEGTDLGEITLTLYADGKQITPQPEVTREGNKYTYYNLPKYNEEGEEIVYSAKERGIDGYIRIYNNVEPYQDVTSVVHDGGTIVNRETHEEVHELSFKIHKVWTGVEATEEIPAITLTLYCNGEKLDVPTPKPDSEGWYRYYDLPKSVNGKIAVYTVIEEPIAGYTVTYKTAGGEIVEEGVNGGEIINAKIPQTGDHATLGLWLALMGASAVLLMMLQRRRKA